VSYEDVTYEGYGPRGVAVYVELRRTTKTHRLGNPAHFLEVQREHGRGGVRRLDVQEEGADHRFGQGHDEDALMEVALEAGAEDIVNEGDGFVVRTE